MKPNILWICTDSQRWDTLGCYGNGLVRSPRIDALAEEGTLFERAFAQNPLCVPSRGCFLTGRYPIANKLRQNGQDIPTSERIVPRLLADEGYVCGLVGKLHLSACDHRIARYGRDPKGWGRLDRSKTFSGVERRIDDGYAEFHWDHGPGHRDPSSSYTRWLQGLGRSYAPEPFEDDPIVLRGVPEDEHPTTWAAETACQFMEAYRDRPEPWLLSVNLFDPHFNFDPPEAYLEPYLERLDEIPLPVEDAEGEKPPYYRQFAAQGKGKGQAEAPRIHRRRKAAYWAMCDLIDVGVGKMLDALEATGQREDTLVIFTSDHGEMLGDHGIYKKGPFLADPAIRVPLVMRWPGRIPAGRRLESLVELGDLAPTLMEAAGQPVPRRMQCRSFWPLASSAEAPDRHREDVYCEYLNSNPNQPPQYCTMVRTGDWKLVAFHGQEVGELYDLRADPQERRNLWADPAAASTKTALLKRLADRLAFTADPLPERIGIF